MVSNFASREAVKSLKTQDLGLVLRYIGLQQACHNVYGLSVRYGGSCKRTKPIHLREGIPASHTIVLIELVLVHALIGFSFTYIDCITFMHG